MSAPSSRLVLDVTLTMGMRGRIASGIPRVESELTSALLRRNDPNIVFCRYRAKVRAFQFVPREAVREALLQPQITPVVRRSTREPSYSRQAWKGVETAWRRYLFRPSNLIRLAPSDTYVAVGAWWNTFDKDQMQIFQLSECRTLVMCHDVFPLLYPEFFEDRGAEYKFRQALSLFSTASTVLCNSQATRHDLSRMLAAAGLALPAMSVLYLPPGISAAHAAPQRPAGLSDGRFVLSVGSISRRKNQAMLCNIWSRLGDDPELRDVRLIAVGAWGDFSAPIREQLQRDRRLAGRMMVLDRTTDSELAWLYSHCLFTVYPSLYEGWGLPIGESLSFGKLCVAADTSSMPEAGQGLCLHLPPQDPESWYWSIRELLLDPRRRAAYESKIKLAFHAATWDEFAARIIEAVRK